MATTFLIIHIIIAVLMIGLVLFQKNEGGGLGMGSSTMGGLMSSRGTANLLTRTTAVLATLFFISTLGLALLFKGSARQKSLFQESSVSLETPTEKAAEPAVPGPVQPLPEPVSPSTTQK